MSIIIFIRLESLESVIVLQKIISQKHSLKQAEIQNAEEEIYLCKDFLMCNLLLCPATLKKFG